MSFPRNIRYFSKDKPGIIQVSSNFHSNPREDFLSGGGHRTRVKGEYLICNKTAVAFFTN